MNRDNKYRFNIFVLTLMMFMQVIPACDRMEDELNYTDEVRLKASLSSALSSVYTKGIGEIKSDHAVDLHIGMARVGGEVGNFDEAGNTLLSAQMKAWTPENLGIRDIEFDDFQGFPDASSKLNYLGWYPFETSEYSNPDAGHTTVRIPVPNDASTDILYSDVASGTRQSGFNTLTFRHALVKYSIKVYAMESDEGEGLIDDVWGEIKSVALEEMPSTCVLTLPESSGKLPVVTSEGSADLVRNTPLTNLPVGFSQAADLTYFLAPPPSDNILRIKVITEKDGEELVKSQTLSIARDFQIGKHYQIYLRFTIHGIISAEVVAADWNQGETIDVDTNTGVYYDLSESHTANTYIVSSAYNYCFDVTVRGNGYTGIAGIPGAAGDIYKVGNPVKAEIIWTDLVKGNNENLDEFFTLSSFVTNGKVFFTVKSASEGSKLKREGNVLVGVRDAAGQMLWTWHIWITDRPHEQGYKNGFSVLDRDMGATAYNPADVTGTIAGFYYQWGRPTPLPLDKDVYKPEYNADGTWKSNSLVTFEERHDILPVIDRVKSPTSFFTQKATASDKTITKSLWGWRAEADEYAKTIYDPCPPGYRMPSKRLWRDLVILDQNNDLKHDANVVSGHNGIKAAEFKVDVNHVEVFYPMTGYYTDRTNHLKNNEGAYMWAATFELGALNDLEDDLPYGLDFVLKTGSETELDEMQTVTEPSNHAMPVRCISRMSKAHVTDLSDYQTANSYMVNDVGYYKFKATVRGNGVGQLVSPGTTSTIVLTEQLNTVDIKNQLVKVEPLWWHTYASAAPTVDELNAGKHFTFLNDGKPDSDGYVSFRVDEFFEGNLILAGRDAKNEIIWSWHIWFTDDPKMMKSNSFVVMDRNLGATHAPLNPTEPTDAELSQTYGLYYQWGRKDPFTIPDETIYKYDNQTAKYESTESAFVDEKEQLAKTVANSVSKPMTYHLASDAPASEGIFNNADFFSSYSISDVDNGINNQCFSNMVHPENINSLWGYSAASGYGVTTTKTMYDPCPPGYIVAHYLVWTNTERNGSSAYNYYSNLDTGWKKHDIGGTGGFYTTKHSALFSPVWYPFSGYINGKDGQLMKQGNMGIFHTSTPAGNGSRSLAYNSTYSGQIVDNSYRGLPSTFAYPVRCQKE